MEPITSISSSQQERYDILKCISGAEVLELDSTDGKETIANAGDLFTGWLDPNFKEYRTNVPGPETEKMNVTVHDMIKDGTFEKIFADLGEDLDKLSLTQAQIIQFVKKHRKWLRTESYGTFFLFKVGQERFVGNVDFTVVGKLKVRVLRFSSAYVWFAGYRHRFVVPQQVLEN